MLSFIKGIILLPIAILVVLLAVANRQSVLVSFDPFSGDVPELAIHMPLFAVVFAAVFLGAVIGGVGAWLGQADTRRARRQAAREVSRLRAEAERARAYTVAAPSSGSRLPVLSSGRA